MWPCSVWLCVVASGSFERVGDELTEWRARRGSEAAMWLWRISIISWIDHDLLEEDCIEEFLEGVRCVYVEVMAVLEEVKGLAEAGPAGTVPDFAGPKEETLVDMVRAFGEAAGRRGFVLPTNMRGVFGKMQRSGGLLPREGAKLGSLTFDQWLDQL